MAIGEKLYYHAKVRSFKSVQNYINETKPDGTVVTRFTPIAPYDTSDAVERLCTAYEQVIASEKVDVLFKNEVKLTFPQRVI